MRIGSLFSGAGGLDMAVEYVFGATTAWHCEIDPAASKVLAARWGGVPNYHDITQFDWGRIEETGSVESVDILCGGYPCQPFSAAGRRKGADDERHLWPYFAKAIRSLRPRYVVLENVAGHRSMGFDRVLGDLAEMRYDTQWCSIRASDVGAPHRRERLFVLAHPGGEPIRQQPVPEPGSSSTPIAGQHHPTASHAEGKRRPGRDEPRQDVVCDGSEPAHAGSHGRTASDAPCDGRDEGRPESARLVGRPDATERSHGPVDLLPTPRRSDGDGGANPLSRAERMDDVETRVIRLLNTPSVADGGGGHLARSGSRGDEPLLPGQAIEMAQQWGKYAAAIARWEAVARLAPPPAEPNPKGNPRLSAAFSEWLMGWPAGWVTDPDIGISRNDQLRIIGNGVVPQQAIAALQSLLNIAKQAA